jgi:hypothetical protein
MASLHKYRRGGRASVSALIECIPDDGCLLVFNAKHAVWRSKASTLGLFTVTKVGEGFVKRGDNATTTDLMISWRKDNG